ncbi:glycosyltransferase family 4 protein [Candidatus Falkowbacteria bacterium]|nr:glycosyltransferase family 4 protein [Candidatus Falkowbacteria bacterium]
MKILIFSLAYQPFVGGAEVAIKEITDRLPAGSDFKFEMITANLDGRQKIEEKMGNVLVHRIGNGKLSKYFFPWLAYKKAVALQKENHYDTIWAMMANQAGWAALKFKKKFPEVRYLLTLQEGDSEWDIWLRTFLIRPIYKQIYRRADYIQAISNFLANRAKTIGARCPIEVVPNGIKINNQETRYNNQIKNQKPTKRIITVSRLVKKNGIEYLIRAMKNIDGELLVLGDGGLRKKLEKLAASLNINNRIKFLGNVPYEKVYEYLSQTSVFVRPSLSEGLGNAFLEAMSVGIPVIGTRVGGIPDFLIDGETGWFCQVKNPKGLAEKINYVLDEKNKNEVEKVVENAYKMVSEKYNWNIITGHMSSIFQNLKIKN